MKPCVVIPARNEAATIASLVAAARSQNAEVIVADDSSTDSTADAAREAGAAVAVVPKDRRGLVGVYTHGLRTALAAGFDTIVEMDAGGSHDPHQLQLFWQAMREGQGNDVAFGRRFGPEAAYRGSLKRELLSRGGTLLTNLAHSTHFLDATSGFIAYRRRALELLLSRPLVSSGHFYQTELRLRAVQLGLRFVEVPITYSNSGSSLNYSSIKEALRLVRALP